MKKGVIALLSAVVGGAAGAVGVGKLFEKKIAEKKDMSDKHLSLFLMMNQWVRVKQEKKNLSSYFEKYGYKEIAVYGMSFAGETLVEELKDSPISIAYGIDKNSDFLCASFDIITIEDNLDKVDAIVVTAITHFDEIKEKLSGKIDCPIISLEDVLYEV